MTPNRLQIRQAMVARLKCAGTFAGERYYSNRFRPVLQADVAANDQPNLPMGCVYTLQEAAESNEGAPREYKRSLEAAVELIVARAGALDDDADDRLDQLIEQVERVFFKDATLGLDRVDVTLLRTEFSQLDQGDLAYAAARVVFTVTYWQIAGEGDVDDLPNYLRADVQLRGTSPDGGTVVAEDLIEVGG